MKIKELLENKINGNYKIISSILKTSEWGAKGIIEGKVAINLDNLQALFDYFGIDLVTDISKAIKYEISTEVNQKTFKFYAGYWLKKKEFEVKESTYANYCNLFINYIIPCLGDITFEKFNNNIIQAFAYWCKKEKNLSEHSIRDNVNLVKSVLRDGQNEGVFPEFIIKKIKIPKTLKMATKQTYSEKEYEKIMRIFACYK